MVKTLAGQRYGLTTLAYRAAICCQPKKNAVWDGSGVLLELLFASFSLCVAVLQDGMHLRLVLAWLSDSALK